MRRLLFVCSRNRLRSPTAEAVFASLDGLEVSSAGTSPDAECAISHDLIEWADSIFVMEKRHKKILQERFGKAIAGKTVVSLNIPDCYSYMQTELVDLLRMKMAPFLNRS